VGASNGELIRWVFERLDAHDVASLAAVVWDDETVERFPNRVCRGADEICAYFEETFIGMPDAHFNIVALAEQGEDVFVHWQISGTHKGAWLGITPTGKPVDLEGIDHFVIRDGRIRTGFIAFDQLESGRQLGMMPPDGSAADRAMKSAFNLRTRLMQRRHARR
jgi:steroid delta-isomerase-like uncharacterized protein